MMKKKLIFGLIVVISIIFAVIWYKNLQKPEILPFANIPPAVAPNKNFYLQTITDLCKEEENIKCYGNCKDGFGEIGYFDSRKYNKEDFLHTPGELYKTDWEKRKMSFATHYQSNCDPCGNKFKLNKNGVLQEVSCEEFFQTIEDFNKTCNDCVDNVYLQIAG